MRPEILTTKFEYALPQARRNAISVVIVVWNAKKYVLDCLESLSRHCAGLDLEVIIVDNASTDGTPELVERRFPDFKLIRNSENLGFAKANNIGIQASSGEYICLVNSDVKFTGDCISPMMRYLIANPDVSMLGPKMLAANGEVRRSTMRFPTVWNQFCRSLGLDLAVKGSHIFGGLLMADFDHQSTRPVEVLAGWFLMVRRSAVQRVGLLDPQFFIYGEDVDWCYRFRQAGEQVLFFADGEAIHYGGASSSHAPLRFYLEQYFANFQYWRKHHGWFGQLSFLATMALHHFVRLVAAAFAYVFISTQRAEWRDKIGRSLACLRWISHPQRRQSDVGPEPDSPVRNAQSPLNIKPSMNL
jgi:GT2 family glycosyltransferase